MAGGPFWRVRRVLHRTRDRPTPLVDSKINNKGGDIEENKPASKSVRDEVVKCEGKAEKVIDLI